MPAHDVETNTDITEVIGTQQTVVDRQITLTQTITYADSTTTAVVTLDRENPPTDTPLPPVRGPSSQAPDGLTPAQIGIIVGTLIGAVLLALLVWICCVAQRRRRAYIDRNFPDGSEITITSSMYEEFIRARSRPLRRVHYWPEFRPSIPPPVIPVYRATPPPRQWTTTPAILDEVRRASTSYIYRS